MKTPGYIVIIVLIVCMLESCGSRDAEQHAIVKEWKGKEIELPQGLHFQIQDTPIDYDFDNADFKILTYIDSTGCTNCKMKLREWDRIINEFKSDPDVEVNFLMIVNSTNRKEITRIINENSFQHPVCVDTIGQFCKIISLPSQIQYQTFLLNRENEVIAIGNPVTNPKIKKLFRQQISEISDNMIDYREYDPICQNPVMALGIIDNGDTIHRKFTLTNDKIDNLTLQEIIPSCHCIAGSAEFSSIPLGTRADINVTYIADSISHPICQYLDIYFKEYEKPVRLLLHGFVDTR